MSDEKTTPTQKNKARRKLLKGIVAGGGALTAGKALPENWAKPVVESVTLPAHAQTTTDAGSESIQDLSPFQSGTQPLVFNDLDNSEERFAALDAPLETADWDKLSDSEILDFFARPANAGTSSNTASTFEVFAEVDGNTGSLCIFGNVYDTNFEAFLTNTPVNGNTIKGGPATVFYGVQAPSSLISNLTSHLRL